MSESIRFTCAGLLLLGLSQCGHKSAPESRQPPPAATVEAPPSPDAAPVEVTRIPEPTEPESEAPAPAVEAPMPEPLSDAQIARIADLANAAEVDQAKIAQTRAKDARVRKFAAMMIQDHGQARQKQAKIVAKLKLQPAESPPAAELETEAASTLAALKSTTALAFDHAYVASQVDAHKKVLALLTTRLIPNATDPELKALLQGLQPTIEHHLKEAEALQQSLGPVPAEEAPSTPAKK